jgi:hypothetical protein
MEQVSYLVAPANLNTVVRKSSSLFKKPLRKILRLSRMGPLFLTTDRSSSCSRWRVLFSCRTGSSSTQPCTVNACHQCGGSEAICFGSGFLEISESSTGYGTVRYLILVSKKVEIAKNLPSLQWTASPSAI